MARTVVSVSITRQPSNVGVKVDGKRIKMARDTDSNWAGTGTLDLPDKFQLAVGAVGVPNAKYTVAITFSTPPPESKDRAEFKKKSQIPKDLLDVIHADIDLTKEGDE
jgi:hypothetical protein